MLTNLTFSATHRLQSDEIDIVAIGPPGVRVIEVKHWTAAWVNRNSDLVEQEADRLTNKARKIGTTLRKHLPALGRVDGAFLVTETASKVKALEKQVVRGVPFHTFKTWRGAVGLDSQSVLSSQQIKGLAA
ncbi:MAG: nuclease-related domain-containing protein [Bryobacterales bacterium]|nr:nuclease-related domain-containing protein [Bryobacterales bacterium]MDE0296906.1 nuclease-related domain-containing protein [Bryobacterales bacterium]